VFNDANGFDGTINLVGSVATLTITTALTTGSVGFIGASGALLQDNANFFWDDTNNRLGIGTNAPTTALDIFGSGIIQRLNGTSTNNASLGFASNGTNKWSIGNILSDHRFRIFSEANSAELITILQTGEFGIGIANPLTKLHIDGGATALIANLDANVSVAKSLSFRSDNSNRINLEVSGTESGSDAGANLFLRTYSDAGALLYTPLTITRSTGLVSIGTSLEITGTTIIRLMSGSALNIRGDDTLNSDFGLTWTTTTYTGGIAAIKVARRGASDASDMMFFTAPNGNTPQERLRITSTGTLGIGTTTLPYGMVTIKSNSSTSYAGLNVFANSNNNFIALNHTGTLGIIETESFTGGGFTPIAFVTGGAERMRITTGGFVGIATSNPDLFQTAARNLVIGSGTGNNGMTIFSGTAHAGSLHFADAQTTGAASYAGYINYEHGTDTMNFGTSSTERMRITSGGMVGIGTAGASSTRLTVAGADATGSNYSVVFNNNTTTMFFIRNDGLILTGSLSASPYNLSTTGRNAVIESNGVLGYLVSTRESKANIKSIENIDFINQLNPVSFNYRKKDYDTNTFTDELYDNITYGFIADEVEKVNKDLAFYNEDGSLAGVEYNSIIAILTKAVQELNIEVELLKAKIL
jgi:hypothetical protein